MWTRGSVVSTLVDRHCRWEWCNEVIQTLGCGRVPMQDDARPGVVALRCGEPHRHDTNPTATFVWGNKLSRNRSWDEIRQRRLIQCSVAYRQSIRTMPLDCRHICAASCVHPPPLFLRVWILKQRLSHSPFTSHIAYLCRTIGIILLVWEKDSYHLLVFSPPWRQSFSGVIIYLENPPWVHGTSVLLERKCAFVKYQDGSFALQLEFYHLDVAVHSVRTLQRMNCKKSPECTYHPLRAVVQEKLFKSSCMFFVRVALGSRIVLCYVANKID